MLIIMHVSGIDYLHEDLKNNYVSIICLSFVVVFTMDFNNFPLIHRDNPYSHTS